MPSLSRVQRPIVGLLFVALAVALSSASSADKTAQASPTQQAQQPTALSTIRTILLTDSVPDPKQVDVQYFAPTGHTLRGSFLDYWQHNGGLAQFGYPLTEEFTEPIGKDGAPVMVQYFERNRFEQHPENAGTPYEVLLGTLGREFHQQDAAVQPLPSPALFFPETGHSLSGTFKAYWETHGGLAIHGYPITEQFEEKSPTDGKSYTVQYFERSRFELHPENAGSPYEVLLGQLGVQLTQKKGYPYGWYPPLSHASDLSWISGYVQFYGPGEFLCNGCGCSLFRYGQQTDPGRVTNVMQLNTPNGGQYRFSRSTANDKPLLVVFGRTSQSGVTGYPCSGSEPIYFVQYVQANPAK